MRRRLFQLLGWPSAALLALAILLREIVGLWGNVDFAVKEYHRLGGVGAVMGFILDPPPGAFLGGLLLLALLLVCLNWQKLLVFLTRQSSGESTELKLAVAKLTKQNRLQDKQDQVREGLRDGASNRRIRMTVGENGPYFDTEGSVYNIKRTFSLKLENTDLNKSVSNCSVNILSVAPPTDYEGPWRLREGLELASGDHVFIPLVTYGEAREPDKYASGDTFITMGTAKGRPYLEVGEEYTVTLRATAPETAFCEFQCRVWVDENGRLRIEGD